ncbi:ATP-dependent Clp protease proteolytic subunit [Indioceanicola profundi]|uniref:ATP-dependent Clp protease proteolytic subunit n=1 Tax=Indioceanicola profundi TaxID=2220096 RepID=UPI000E6ACB67|nr:ATP-dependent Clp protease proteolytic subunit [Indioceanicola profundi]
MLRAASLALFFSVALPLSACQAAETAAARVKLTPAKVTVTQAVDMQVLRIDGVITPEVAADFKAALDAMPAGAPLTLELNSPGGYTSAGYDMMDRLMTERQKGRRVITVVRGREICESMCVGLFMAGEARYAAPTAQFMVHAPRGLNSGTVTIRSTGRMIDRLVNLGASTDWIERVKAAGGFSGLNDYRTSAAQLAQDQANVVTALME